MSGSEPKAKAGSEKKAAAKGFPAGAMVAGTVCLLALPSAVLAFSSRFVARPAAIGADVSNAPVRPAVLALGYAPTLPVNGAFKNSKFHFTPAGIASRPERSLTVAVRLDPKWEDTILVQGSVPRTATTVRRQETVALQIAPTAFSLGVARGYHSFAQNLVPNTPIRKLDMPDLANLKGSIAQPEDAPSRFNPKIVLDQRQATGRAPRTFAGAEEVVDVGGSYRVTRNIDVTAGVRYTQERHSLRPLTDQKKDNQAVYVGTQFRF
jgi:hypothetical protein